MNPRVNFWATDWLRIPPIQSLKSPLPSATSWLSIPIEIGDRPGFHSVTQEPIIGRLKIIGERNKCCGIVRLSRIAGGHDQAVARRAMFVNFPCVP